MTTEEVSKLGLAELASKTFDLEEEESLDFNRNYQLFGARRTKTDQMLRTAEKYNENYGEEKLTRLSEKLRIEGKSVGNDLWNFLKSSEADILASESEDKIDEILEANSEINFKEEIEQILDSKYK